MGELQLVDRRRHARTARIVRAAPKPAPAHTHRVIHRGVKGRSFSGDLFSADHGEPKREGRFRWLLSTCLAATVGSLAIFVVIFGSADQQEASRGLMPALKSLRDSTQAPPLEAMLRHEDGLKWNIPKVDKLRVTSGAASTRFIIHETLRQKRAGREYIYAKPYVRIVSRLAPVPQTTNEVIPPFNPVTLYDNDKQQRPNEVADGDGRSDILIKVVELLGSVLPGEDGLELDAEEAQALADKAAAPAATATAQSTDTPQPDLEQQAALGATPETRPEEAVPPLTTVLTKQTSDDTDDVAAAEYENLKPTVRTVRQGEKLSQILVEAGAETWQAREMIEAMKGIFPERNVLPGQEVHIALQPSLTRQNRMEPVRFSIYDEGHAHKVTVARSNAGEFVASATPMDEGAVMRTALATEAGQQTSLYASLYHASLQQSVPADTITQILRIHAYETDYRRRLRAGDMCEFFFDLKDDVGTDGPPGELLFTSITSGGETSKYYRFRTSDGHVDYYDAAGNNSKKFLMRKPVRGDDVRLTSGFGFRFHPLLNEKRMHTGVDWATTYGAPIVASGNGTIEEAGRKGHYGNYVRIRHANGYQTAYGHMTKFAPGAAPGVKVRQGQVIGYVGSTGLSSGPHLHFEVLINNQFVDPMSIRVPRERQLEGKELIDFQKERARIDDLMRRAPVMTASK